MIDAAGPWGTGPFEVKDGTSTLEKRAPVVTLAPNKNYWNKDRMAKATFKFDNVISKQEAIEEVMKGGKMHIVTELLPQEAKQVEKSKHAKVVKNDAKTILVGVFNQNSPNSKWTDVNLRKAANLAVDRKAVLKDGGMGYGTIHPSFIQKGQFGYNSSLKPYGHKPDEAKKALNAAGVKEITIVAGEGHKGVVDALAKNFEAVGVKVNKDMSGAPKGDKWDIWLVEHFDGSPNYPMGVVFREFFGDSGGFRKMKNDTKFEGLQTKVLATTGDKEQGKLMQEMDKYVYDNANVLFLCSPAKLYAVSNKVNFVPYDTTVLELVESGWKK
ncbi:MAG: ABC transporter substrate-binding protein [Burkholderiales bacterium]|nr:ABC transporter substrate-binding protein [Burkholderiales bacterium]